MMINEFTARTGFYPTEDLYRTIEAYYYEFDGDKDEFCEAYKNNTDGLAETIRNQTDIDRRLGAAKMKEEIDAKTAEVERLTKALECEQEWTAYEDHDNVKQADYDNLKKSGRVWDDEEAKAWIADDFGFAPEKIKILHSVPVYEINRHRQLRKIGEAERLPLYEATDWNYVRFDCGLMSYELDNGMLRFYER